MIIQPLDTNEGTTLDRGLGFMAYAVVVDNYSGSWAYVPSAGVYVRPWVYGAVVPLSSGVQQAHIIWQVPPGIPVTPIGSGVLTSRWTDTALAPNQGDLILVPGSQRPVLTSQVVKAGANSNVTWSDIPIPSGVRAMAITGVDNSNINFGSLNVYDHADHDVNWGNPVWTNGQTIYLPMSAGVLSGAVDFVWTGLSNSDVIDHTLTVFGITDTGVSLIPNNDILNVQLPNGANVTITANATGAGGQKTMALSLPVVIASDQSDVGVNVDKYGGTATTLGQKLMTASVPCVLASNQSALPVTLPATGSLLSSAGGGNNQGSGVVLSMIAGVANQVITIYGMLLSMASPGNPSVGQAEIVAHTAGTRLAIVNGRQPGAGGGTVWMDIPQGRSLAAGDGVDLYNPSAAGVDMWAVIYYTQA